MIESMASKVANELRLKKNQDLQIQKDKQDVER